MMYSESLLSILTLIHTSTNSFPLEIELDRKFAVAFRMVSLCDFLDGVINTSVFKIDENGYIDVVGVGFTKNSVTREYKAVVSQAEYISVFLEDKTSCEIAKNYIKKISDIDKLKEIEEMIKERKLELEIV